jgi:hypothetical protein
VGRQAKLVQRILSGRSDANIRFSDLISLLPQFGFAERTKGDHHTFTMNGVEEILNLQPKGAMAKAYQVKQVRQVIVRYRLGANAHE